MYTKILNPSLAVYDIETNELIGTAKFNLAPNSENDLLQLVNSNRQLSSLLLLNLVLIPVKKSYISEVVDKSIPRRGILSAIYTNPIDKLTDRIDIQMKFKVRAYSFATGIPLHFESVSLSNIDVESKKGKSLI